MSEIVLDGVTKRFPDGTTAVEELNLEIADQEFVILVGPSGCGKSTTLNMIAGLEDISGGELRIDGKRVNEVAPRDRDIAMVFQSYALYPHMTVGENIGFPLKLAKMSKADIKTKVDEAAQILDLTSYLDRKPGALSGGQRQRVAMGRAIVRNPKAFLMDEPLSNLDAKLRVQMRTSISRIQKRLGTTTVYVTHDQTEAMTLGDRIVIMRAGVVQQVGSPQDLYDHPVNLFVAGFIGSPSMNFVPATLTDNSLETVLGRIPLTDRVRRSLEARSDVPKELVIGLRPEAFEDDSLVEHRGAGGATFTGTVDILESMGSEKYAYFSLENAHVDSEHLAEIERDTGGEEVGAAQIVCQLDARSGAREGRDLDVWFNSDAIQVFEPSSGENLTASH
ncbi:MAG: sn-glycerol-3-phosphate ABC transporter ATP-binding protein UgpC [Actinocatenispora sp.]